MPQIQEKNFYSVKRSKRCFFRLTKVSTFLAFGVASNFRADDCRTHDRGRAGQHGDFNNDVINHSSSRECPIGGRKKQKECVFLNPATDADFTGKANYFNSWAQKLHALTPSRSAVKLVDWISNEKKYLSAPQLMATLDARDLNKILTFVYHYENSSLVKNGINENQKVGLADLKYILEHQHTQHGKHYRMRKVLLKTILREHKHRMIEIRKFRHALRVVWAVSAEWNEMLGACEVPKYRPFIYMTVTDIATATGKVYAGVKTTYNKDSDIILFPSYPMKLSHIGSYLFVRPGYVKYYTPKDVERFQYNAFHNLMPHSGSPALPVGNGTDSTNAPKNRPYHTRSTDFTKILRSAMLDNDNHTVAANINKKLNFDKAPILVPPRSLETLIRNPILKVFMDYFQYINKEPQTSEKIDDSLAALHLLDDRVIKTVVQINEIVVPLYIKFPTREAAESLLTRLTSFIAENSEQAYLGATTGDFLFNGSRNLHGVNHIRLAAQNVNRSFFAPNDINEEIMFGPHSRFVTYVRAKTLAESETGV